MIVKDFKKFFDHQGLCFIHFVLFFVFFVKVKRNFSSEGFNKIFTGFRYKFTTLIVLFWVEFLSLTHFLFDLIQNFQ
jgi:hypothetical protein